MRKRTLYPSIHPYKTHYLKVDRTHKVYVEECGNPHGIPILFLHGGPGAGCTPTHRQFFNHKYYRIILFDQRGCGKSTPHAELKNNTTQHLIKDIETIRKYLGIKTWLIFGGSWGSTLALAYAEEHSHLVTGLVLRGIFLCRDQDIYWFYQKGASRLFPDYWQDFIDPISQSRQDNIVNAFYKLLTGDDKEQQLTAAKAWSTWEGRTATLIPDSATEKFFSQPSVALSMARIECHYFMNHAFMQANQLLDNAHRLRSIPGIIVHGRYDSICPIDQAFALKEAWPNAKLKIILDAGHAATEPGIIDALITATDHFSKKAIENNH